MADFAPNYTARYRVRYTSLGQTHVMTFRLHPGGADLAPVATAVADFLNTFRAQRWTDWTVIGADYAGENSDIFLPTVQPAPLAGQADGGFTGVKPAFMSFNGRGATGSKARLFVYGINQIPTANAAYLYDYRILSTELASVAAAVDALGDIPNAVAIDRSPVNWYPYVNLGLNAYYQRKQRG